MGILQPDVRLQLGSTRIFPDAHAPPRGIKIQAVPGPPLRFGRPGALPFRSAALPRNVSNPKGETPCNVSQFLAATGHRLRYLGKVVSHLFRKGKLGLKLSIKIPFFIEIEITYETDWKKRR